MNPIPIDVSKYIDAKGLVAEIKSKYSNKSTLVNPWADDSMVTFMMLREIYDLLLVELIFSDSVREDGNEKEREVPHV